MRDQITERCIFLLVCLFVQNRIMKVFPSGRGCKDLKTQIQLALEIVTDIADNLLLCRWASYLFFAAAAPG